MRFLKMALLSLLVVGGMIATAAAYSADAAQPSRGGEIRLFTTLNSKARTPAVVTGAIGDYGTLVSIDRDGRPDINGDFAKLVLRHGTIELDGRQLTASMGHGAKIDAATCSLALSNTAPVPILDGTGAYAGIHGTLTAHAQGGVIGRLDPSGPHRGTCEEKENVPPLAILGSIIGTGRITLPASR